MPGGTPCRAKALPGMPYCRNHLGPLERSRKLGRREFVQEWRRNVERAVARRASSEPPKDNYDEALVKALLPLAFPIYNWYWRVGGDGIENIPTAGPGLLGPHHPRT